jgi:hypothetical protein
MSSRDGTSTESEVARARLRRSMLIRAVLGEVVELPDDLVARFPELGDATWRAGGLPPRVGGWFLGRSSVAAITLWRTVYLAPGIAPHAELLLHELGHVRQFGASLWFPLRYLWESIRRGYSGNRYEHEAQAFAEARLRSANLSTHA